MSTPELKSETPITDAAIKRVQVGGFNSLMGVMVVDPEVCRKLESALNAAREAIENAPHEYGNQTCNDAGNLVKRDGFWVTGRCTCWKAEALAQIDKILKAFG